MVGSGNPEGRSTGIDRGGRTGIFFPLYVNMGKSVRLGGVRPARNSSRAPVGPVLGVGDVPTILSGTEAAFNSSTVGKEASMLESPD